MEPDVAWVAEELPELGIGHQGFAWPGSGVDPFGLGHEETATLYWARGKPTRAILGEPVDDQRVDDAIPMGYTNLVELEKLAVVAAGNMLRVWPHGDRATHRGNLQPYQLILPPGPTEATRQAEQPEQPGPTGYLMLGASWPFRYGLQNGVEASRRTGGAVLVCRVLGDTAWH